MPFFNPASMNIHDTLQRWTPAQDRCLASQLSPPLPSSSSLPGWGHLGLVEGGGETSRALAGRRGGGRSSTKGGLILHFL